MNLCYDTEAKNPYEHVSLVSNSFSLLLQHLSD